MPRLVRLLPRTTRELALHQSVRGNGLQELEYRHLLSVGERAYIMAGEEVIRSFRDLHAWQTAMELVLVSYGLVKRFPATERFELNAQMRRSAVSIPSNIAEGQSYGADGRYLHHIRIAQGSLGELETEFEIAKRLGFIKSGEYGEAEALCSRTGQLLNGLARSVKRRRLQRIGHRTALAILAVMPVLYILR
jgi:four helix bundle protein